MSELAKAVIAVMKTVKGMEKNSKVGTGQSSYDGTKDMDVKEVFNEAMAENGLCIFQIGVDPKTTIERWEEINNYGGKEVKKIKQQVFTEVKTRYKLLHISGENEILESFGYGVDSQDKGAGKATTYSLKNLLLYTFLTPVGKIDDTDTTHSADIPVAQAAPVIELTAAQIKKQEAVGRAVELIRSSTNETEWMENLKKVSKLAKEPQIKLAAKEMQTKLGIVIEKKQAEPTAA
jgi:hypothetical protein